jgi:hypothetical protein
MLRVSWLRYFPLPEVPAHVPISNLLHAQFPTPLASCSCTKRQTVARATSHSPAPPAHTPRLGRAPHCCALPSSPRSDTKSPSPSLAAAVQVRMANPNRCLSSNIPNHPHQFIMPRFISEGSNDHRRVLHHDGLGGRAAGFI